uniref:Uncharacterized protein n=1 Tax=Ditylenchus dipsaci TaxID=166011 RepID=A0A915EBA1_9BILA
MRRDRLEVQRSVQVGSMPVNHPENAFKQKKCVIIDMTATMEAMTYFLNAKHEDERRRLLSLNSSPSSSQAPTSRECTDQEFRCPNCLTTYVFTMKNCVIVETTVVCDWSDEQNCDSGSIEDMEEENERRETRAKAVTVCAAGEFQCKGGSKLCIAGVKKCNREYECDDGSDELDCHYFREAHNRAATARDEKERRRLHYEHHLRLVQQHREKLRLEEERRRAQRLLGWFITEFFVVKIFGCNFHAKFL